MTQPEGIWCEYHQTHHPKEVHQTFLDHSKKLHVKVKRDDCPIRLLMEANTVNIVQPQFMIVNAGCTEVEKWPQSVDLLITKLPVTEKEGYTSGNVSYVANQTYYHMNNNSLGYVIVSAYKDDKSRPYDVIKIFEKAGFNFIDTLIWVRNKFTPTQGGKRLNNVYDFILQFAKGDNYHLDRAAVSYLKSAFDDKESDSSKEHLCPGNVWRIKMDDKDVLPDELIQCLIDVSNIIPKSTIIDPFMQDGIVLRLALKNSLGFWGCEADRNQFKKCKTIIKDYQHQVQLAIQKGKQNGVK